MDEIVCARSAFRYWRCPPQIREMYPVLPWGEQGWRELKHAAFAEDVLGLPIDVLRQKGEPQLRSNTRRSLFWEGGFEPGETVDSGLGFSVTSPLLTLFTLTRFLDLWDLVMAMYEICGQFAVFELPVSIREPALASIVEERKNDQNGDFSGLYDDEEPDDERWACVFGKAGRMDGKPTSLWRRKPLVEYHELHDFAERMEPRRWGRKFYNAAQLVFGVAASPLEVQGALLFGAPRWRGGSGFGSLLLNEMTPLSASARRLCAKRTCYGDILITNAESLETLIIECQGEMIHGSGAIQASDSERVAALQSMGYSVLLVSYDMLRVPSQFEVIENTVFEMLGLKRLFRTQKEEVAAFELRRAIFCNWANLV